MTKKTKSFYEKKNLFFRNYLLKADPPKTDRWQRLETKPEATIINEELSQFKKQMNFYYFEYGGEKTLVKTDSNYWLETFSDRTYSKLNYQWIGKNKFDLIVIESSNNSRKNFSKKAIVIIMK